MRISIFLLLLLTGCDAAPVMSDGGSTQDSDVPVAPVDAGTPVSQRDPCNSASCWDTALSPPRCVSRGIDENFSSGRYSVHRFEVTVRAAVETTIRLERSAGVWQPALIVSGSDGRVLLDGTRGTERDGLSAVVVLEGAAGAVAEVRITNDRDLTLSVHVTGSDVIASNFVELMPTNAAYRLDLFRACDGGAAVPCVVNGHAVEEPACGWLNYVGREVVPRLDGSRDEALDAASRVAWWALKEGVLFLDNPIVYSNCNTSSGDRRIEPLDTCEPGRAWQVGLSGVQVPGRDLATLEAVARRMYAGSTSDQVLARTAHEAAVDDATRDAIVASEGDRRRSWLLRASAVGFTLQAPTVTRECVDSTRSWCYGTRWRETRLYAPDRTSALAAIDDVRVIIEAAAP